MRWSYPPTAGLFSLDGRVWRLLVFCPALQMPLASRQPEEGSHPKFLEEAIDLQTGPKNTRIPSSTSFLSSLSSSYQTMVRSLVWSGLAIYPTTNMTHAPALARCGRRLATVFFFCLQRAGEKDVHSMWSSMLASVIVPIITYFHLHSPLYPRTPWKLN